ncbi:MAG: hypothetical protein ACFB15_12850 [Cyclobacteriaceae bacterium]
MRLIKYSFLVGGLLLIFGGNSASGQDGYQPGYVVLANGDTLSGLVMDRKETIIGTELLSKIRFKPTDRKRRKKYRPHQLISYQVGNATYASHPIRPKGISLLDAYYEIDPAEGEWTFLRVVRRGNLTHYQKEWVDEDDSSGEAAEFFRKTNVQFLVRATQGIFGRKRKNLIKYFQDCPSLQQKIKEKAFTYPSEVTDYYNQHCSE